MKYKIALSTSVRELEENVQKAIDDGFTICGSPVVFMSLGTTWYMQPVTKVTNSIENNIITDLVTALEHAETRLNETPHEYAKTDFRLIQKALKAAKANR